MIFQLKDYQKNALEALDDYLARARMVGAKAAFEQSGYGYNAEAFGEVPCVCLRIPTGGGKTLMAASAIPRMAKTWGDSDAPVVLWLAPSDAIRSQTLGALQTPGHPYRAALEEAYGQRFTICDLESVMSIGPADWGRQAVVIVATLQSFRVDQTDQRNVYAFSERFEPHFKGLPAAKLAPLAGIVDAVVTEDEAATPGREMLRAFIGQPRWSLANWLAIHSPIIIVDEAHNNATDLSFRTLKRINPKLVLELTATPLAKKTNVLFHVSAQELQAENMIKLPIVLMEHMDGWEAAVFDTVRTQKRLEAEALKEQESTGEYVRPIVLFQAQNSTEPVNADALKKHLVDELHIPEAQVAIATGTQRDLAGVDLMLPSSPVRFIITVQALREGWDCPFAYVLCSVQPVRSATAVEQLLGRVLRMPYAKRRVSDMLNKAYAHVSEPTFGAAANALADKLVTGLGFDPLDMASMIAPQVPLFDDESAGPLFAQPETPTFSIEVKQPLQLEPAANIRIESSETGQRVVVTGHISESVATELLNTQRGEKKKADLEQAINQHNAIVSAVTAPASRGEKFAPVPMLCYREQGVLQLVEREAVLDQVDLDLLAQTPTLPAFNITEAAQTFEVYLREGKVAVGPSDSSQLELASIGGAVTEDDLVRWLDREVRVEGVTQAHLRAYLKALVNNLMHGRGLPLAQLARAKHQLAREVRHQIEDMRIAAANAGFRQLVLDGGWELGVVMERSYEFLPGRYAVAANDRYRGRWDFKKHFYPVIAKLAADGEEFWTAVEIDRHPKVKHWVRNLDREVHGAFWLPTARGKFFPDFIAELVDGRVAVIEYKGAPWQSMPSEIEKEQVGKVWAEKSGGKCLFLFAVAKDSQGRDVRGQLDGLLN
jgi:type III restriction enzyme